MAGLTSSPTTPSPPCFSTASRCLRRPRSQPQRQAHRAPEPIITEAGDGPNFSEISAYFAGLDIEYAILRATWLMENFSWGHFLPMLRDQDAIVAATGEGQLPFVSGGYS
jgi:hypothetical protein